MKRLHITKSILSISSPGTHLSPGNDEEARTLTRHVNTDLSQICASHPEYFRFFASLPLPDVEGALAEIDYAIDDLGAVGFQILTNSHGIYPGDERFRPVFEKLNSRNAIIFVHPTSCQVACTHESLSRQPFFPQPGVPSPMLEFMFDSTRALSSILLSGTLRRFTAIKLLVCHAGGAFPPVMNRIAEFSAAILPEDQKTTTEEIKSLLKSRVYFDLAGIPFPEQIHGLLRVTDPSRLLYGSDYPWTPAKIVESLAIQMDEELKIIFERDIKVDVLRTNADDFLGTEILKH